MHPPPDASAQTGKAGGAAAAVTHPSSEPRRTSGKKLTASAACFHCGEPCPDGGPTKDSRPFCCQGCLVVHELLTESGLGHFYELNPAPVCRYGRPPRGNHGPTWTIRSCSRASSISPTARSARSRSTFRRFTVSPVCGCSKTCFDFTRAWAGPVNYPRREVAISFATAKIKLSELVALLAAIGYEPVLTLDELEERRTDPGRRRRWLAGRHRRFRLRQHHAVQPAPVSGPG